VFQFAYRINIFISDKCNSPPPNVYGWRFGLVVTRWSRST